MSRCPADTADPTLHRGLMVTWPPPALPYSSSRSPGVASSRKPSENILGLVGTSLPWLSLLVCPQQGAQCWGQRRFSGLESHPLGLSRGAE